MNYDNFKIIDRKDFDARELKNYVEYLHNSNQSLIMLFDSIGDAVTCVNDNIKKGFWEDHCRIASTSWTCGVGMTKETTDKALIDGVCDEKWLELVDAYRQKIRDENPEFAALEHQAYLKKRRRKFNEEDGELDIDRYMSNDPAMFAKTTPSLQKGNICRMHFDQNTGIGGDTDTYLAGMAWAVAMIEVIQLAGISVEFTFGFTSYKAMCGVDYTSTIIKMKSASDPLDVQRILSVGLPAIFRYYTGNLRYNLTIPGHHDSAWGTPLKHLRNAKSVTEFLDADVIVKAAVSIDGKLFIDADTMRDIKNVLGVPSDDKYISTIDGTSDLDW